MRKSLPPLTAALAATALLLPLAAQAQAPAPSPVPSQTAPSQSISDAQITKAANAMQQVMTLRQSYGQQIAQAKPEDRDRLAAEGQNAMQQAVTKQGLSVQQYDSILQTAQNDPTVRAKLLSQVTPPTGGTAPRAPSGSPSGQ